MLNNCYSWISLGHAHRCRVSERSLNPIGPRENVSLGQIRRGINASALELTCFRKLFAIATFGFFTFAAVFVVFFWSE